MAERTNPDRALARIARRQHGLVSTAPAREGGLSTHLLHRRMRSGALVRAGAHVMATGWIPRTWEQAAFAACLDVGRGAVLSHPLGRHRLAARPSEESRIDVTIAYGRSARTAGVTAHRSRTLTVADRTFVGRLPVTSLGRTLVDLAGVLGPSRLSIVADDALARRLLTPARLLQTADRLASGRSRRVAILRSVARTWSGSPAMDSVAEASFLRAVISAGLPAPVVQLPTRLPDGATVHLDFAWPKGMVVVEVDGFRWHANPTAHAADSNRANLLAAAGWRVLRATPAELALPAPPALEALRRWLGTGRPRQARHDGR